MRLPAPSTPRRALGYPLAVVFTGIATGLSALGLILLFDAVEWVALGTTESVDPEAAAGVEPWRRFVSTVVGGSLAAACWWYLGRGGRPVPTVADGLRGHRLPFWRTLGNAATQMLAVGSGISVGREAAPRETGALAASHLGAAVGLRSADRTVLVAAAAGAGLGAVYQVPLAGVLLSLEVLLASWRAGTVATALVVSAIATAVTRPVVGAGPVYSVPEMSTGTAALGWAVLLGVLLGAAGRVFGCAAGRAVDKRARGRRLLVALPAVAIALGAVSVVFPHILGNGVYLARIALGDVPGEHLGLGAVLALFVLKTAATLGSLRAGARGGTLTPSLALGALGGLAAAAIASDFGVEADPRLAAVVGAAAFLAAAMDAPVTALVLVAEFTALSTGLFLPLGVAVATSAGTAHLLRRRGDRTPAQ